jgi:hypothetical protein
MAQSNVYSLNVVGYVNVPLVSGYTLVTAQLSGTNNGIATVMGSNFPSGVSVFKWNAASQSLGNPDTWYNTDVAPAAGWYDSNNNPSTSTLSLGEGFFVNSPAATNVTFIGTVSQATNTIPVGIGYSFVGLSVPLASDLTTNSTYALPSIPNLSVFTFDTVGQKYNDPVTYYDTSVAPVAGWYDSNNNPAPVIPKVGQGFLLNSTSVGSWKPSFTVQ